MSIYVLLRKIKVICLFNANITFSRLKKYFKVITHMSCFQAMLQAIFYAHSRFLFAQLSLSGKKDSTACGLVLERPSLSIKPVSGGEKCFYSTLLLSGQMKFPTFSCLALPMYWSRFVRLQFTFLSSFKFIKINKSLQERVWEYIQFYELKDILATISISLKEINIPCNFLALVSKTNKGTLKRY